MLFSKFPDPAGKLHQFRNIPELSSPTDESWGADSAPFDLETHDPSASEVSHVGRPPTAFPLPFLGAALLCPSWLRRLVDSCWKDSSGHCLGNEATVGNRAGGPGSWLNQLSSWEALNSLFFRVFPLSL